MTTKPAQPQDKYVLRLPDGLRDRIKAHAERHGRSMNAEIVRVLEKEFPAPISLVERTHVAFDQLSVLISKLSEREDADRIRPVIGSLMSAFEELDTARQMIENLESQEKTATNKD